MKHPILQEFLSIPADIVRSVKHFRQAMGIPGWRGLLFFCLALGGLLTLAFMLAMGYDRDGPSFMQLQICVGMTTAQTLVIVLIGVMVPLFALVAIGEIIAVVDHHQRYGRANPREKRWMIGVIVLLAVLCGVGSGLLYAWC